MQLGIQRSVEYAANALPASFEEVRAFDEIPTI